MIDMGSLQAAVGSLKTISDIATALLDLRDESKIRAKTMELQRAIIDAQRNAMLAQADGLAQIRRIGELEKHVMELENWTREKERYELHQVKEGVFTYMLKPAMSNGEPPHQLCAKCYQDGIKSILQEEHRAIGRLELLICHRCDAEIIAKGVRPNEPPRPRR